MLDDDRADWQDLPLKVVKNHERVCSIWPSERPNPPGWEDVGFSGAKEECLRYIEQHCDKNCRLKD